MEKENKKIFFDTFNLLIKKKLSAYILNGLSNMLAIDFNLRYESEDAGIYASEYAARINLYLEQTNKQIKDDFHHILELFSIAIKDSKNDDKHSISQLEEHLMETFLENFTPYNSKKDSLPPKPSNHRR